MKMTNRGLKNLAIALALTLVAVGVLGTGLAGYARTGHWFVFSVAPAPPALPDSYDILVHDALDATNDEDFEDGITLAWYGVDAEDMEEDEIEDLVWADFTLEDADDESFTPDDYYIYVLKASGTDAVSHYYTTDDRIFEGNLDELVLGTNNIYLYNESEDISMSAHDELGGTVVLNTVYDEWVVDTFCLDLAEGETAEVTRKEGYAHFYDPENARWMSPCIKITFNTTATVAFASLQDSFENREVCSTTAMTIEINADVTYENEFNIKFGSGLGTTFEVVSIAIGTGCQASFTQTDTQA